MQLIRACPSRFRQMHAHLYLQWLKKKPTSEAVQLAGSALLQLIFLLLHTLLASYHSHHSDSPQDNDFAQLLLSSLSDNVIGNLTVADALWCGPEAILRRMGKTSKIPCCARSWQRLLPLMLALASAQKCVHQTIHMSTGVDCWESEHWRIAAFASCRACTAKTSA